MKKMIAMILAITLLAGCSPVIYNGNLSFTAFDPPAYYGAVDISGVIDDDDLDYDSYNVDGLDAFYFLPLHGNCPNTVLDFQVYDYNSNGDFIYAYTAYYFGDGAEIAEEYGDIPAGGAATGWTASGSGTAPESEQKSNDMRAVTISLALLTQKTQETAISIGLMASALAVPSNEPTHIVTAMLSYNPQTRDYTVFYLELGSLDEIQAGTSSDETGLASDETFSTVENALVGHKLNGSEEYFFYDGTTGYRFAADGTILQSENYYAQALSELKNQGKDVSSLDVEIIDVVMDAEGFAYVAISATPASSATAEELDESDYEPDMEYYLMGTYNIQLGKDVNTDDFIFTSSNLAYEAQKEAWLSIDKKEYDSEAEARAAMAKYSADAITSGALLAEYADQYEPYHYGDMTLIASNGNFSYINGEALRTYANKGTQIGDLITNAVMSGYCGWAPTNRNYYAVDIDDRYTWGGDSTEDVWSGWKAGSDDWAYYYYRDSDIDEPSYFWNDVDTWCYEAGNFSVKNNIYLSVASELPYPQAGYYYKWNEYYALYSPIYLPGDAWGSYGAHSDISSFGELLTASLTEDAKKYYLFDVYPTVVCYDQTLTDGKEYFGDYAARTDCDISYAYEQRDSDATSSWWNSFVTTTYFNEAMNPLAEVGLMMVETGDGKLVSLTYDGYYEYFVGYMTETVTEYSEELRRTVYYTVEETSTDSGDGGESSAVSTTTTVALEEEVWEARPIAYAIGLSRDISLTWMDMRATSELALPSSDLGAYYYNTITDADLEAGTAAVSGISYNDGTVTVLNDSKVQGTAMSASLFQSGDKEVVTLLTDEGVQFYTRTRGESGSATFYKTGIFIELGDFTPNTDNVYVLHSQALDEEASAAYDGEGSGFYSLNQLSILNEEEMVVSALGEGLMLLNLESGLIIQMKSGSYYGSFALETADASDGAFAILGYDSTHYAYSTSDIVWAKVYFEDIGESSDAVRGSMLENYIETLCNLYLQYTHMLALDKNGDMYVSSPTGEDAALLTRTKKLFAGTTATMTTELAAILSEMGGSNTDNAATILSKTLEMRTQLTLQLATSKEIFALAGIVRTPLDTTYPELLLLEGQMYYVTYKEQLEDILVELFLRQVAGLTTDFESLAEASVDSVPMQSFMATLTQYAKRYDDGTITFNADGTLDASRYQLLLQEIDAFSLSMTNNGTAEDGSYGQITLDDSVKEELTTIMSRSDGFVDVITILTGMLNATTGYENTTWSDYISACAVAVSPYNAYDEGQMALETFCDLAGLSQSTVDFDSLSTAISKINRAIDLERLMVEMILTKAAYQNSAYATDWAAYGETTFTSTTAADTAFTEGSFYQLILNCQATYASGLASTDTTTWTKALETVLKNHNGGVIDSSVTGDFYSDTTTGSTGTSLSTTTTTVTTS